MMTDSEGTMVLHQPFSTGARFVLGGFGVVWSVVVLADLSRRGSGLAPGGWLVSLIALLAGALLIWTAAVALHITIVLDFAAGTVTEHHTGSFGVQRVRTKPLAGFAGMHVARSPSSDSGGGGWDVFLWPGTHGGKPLLLRSFRLAEEAEAQAFASEVAGRAGLPVVEVRAGLPMIGA